MRVSPAGVGISVISLYCRKSFCHVDKVNACLEVGSAVAGLFHHAVLLYGLSDEAVRLIPIGWIRWIGCVAAAAWIPALYSVLVKWIEKSPAKDVPKRKPPLSPL